jgi:hypothetical protein
MKTEEQKQKYIAAQKAWLEMTGLKPGDKVKVTRKAKNGEFGWSNSWEPDMSKMVGKELIVNKLPTSYEEKGVSLEKTAMWPHYWYPFFVLEPIQKEPSLSGTVVEVTVNGKTYKATIQ